MKQRNRKTFLVLVTTSLLLNGCTLAGYGIGAMIDASGPDQESVPGWRLDATEPGDRVTAVLTDSSRVGGIFLGTELDKDGYAERYTASRRECPMAKALPEIGSDLRITLDYGQEFRGRFIAFDRMVWNKESINSIWIQEGMRTTQIPMLRGTTIEIGDDTGQVDIALLSESHPPTLSP